MRKEPLEEKDMSMEEVLSSIRGIISEKSAFKETTPEEVVKQNQEFSEGADSVAWKAGGVLQTGVKKSSESTDAQRLVEGQTQVKTPVGISRFFRKSAKEMPRSSVSVTPEKTSHAHTLAHDIKKRESLGSGFENFLVASLEKISSEFLEQWIQENTPRLVEAILRKKIDEVFESYRPSKK